MTNFTKIYSTQTQTARYAGERLLDLVAPPRCINCLQEGTWLCGRCLKRWPFYAQRCAVCETEQVRGITCDACRPKTQLAGIISAGHYQLPALRRGVHWLKFKGVRPMAEVLAELLLPALNLIAPLEHLATTSALVPLPLHQRRLERRGFNQSEDIAWALGGMTGMPVIHALIRPKATQPQSELPKNLRRQNVAGAFQTVAPIPPAVRRLLIVDDVATTGATLSAAAAALRPACTGHIWAATVARG